MTKKIYTVNDFNDFHDKEFIENAYIGILNREVDSSGLDTHLEKLRNGTKTKTEILCDLRYSKEGRKNGVTILGIKKRAVQNFLSKIPIVGYITISTITILTLPRLLKRLNTNEADINRRLKILTSQIDEKVELLNIITSQIDEKVKLLNNNELLISKGLKELALITDSKVAIEDVYHLNNLLNTKADKAELETLGYNLQVEIATKADKAELETLGNNLQVEIATKADRIVTTKEEKHKFDIFYIEFEDRFRGTREDIKQRVEVYLPYIEKLPFKKEDIKVLDVGCGRGEWMELLRDKGYSAQGIDLNCVMVAKSQELGLDVHEADVIEYLQSLADESLSAITGFHIIEHLPFEMLMKLFEESYRVLKKNGMVIFETPNPENLMVGACNFYGDPTHINPIPPHTASFLLEKNNFCKVETKRLHEPDNIHFDNLFLNHQFAVGQDYAVIGYKS